MPFDLQIRLHGADGAQGRVLQTLSRTLAGTESTDAQLKFTMSSVAAEPPQTPFVAGVKYTYDGQAWMTPRNNLFMFDEDSRDESDETQTVTYTGTPYLTWLMQRARLYPLPSETMNGERVWGVASSAGRVMAAMLAEAKGRGWAPPLTYAFAAGYDSNGVAWTDSDKVVQTHKNLSPVSEALTFAVEQGLCDWWTEGMELKLLRPGTGVARPDVVLGGSRMNRVPTSRSFSDVFTHLTVVGEHADHLLHLTNTGASTAFGRLEATMTQSGVGLDATMTRMAQPFMQDGRAVKTELSYEWTPLDDDAPRLWEHFQVGDNVTCITRDGKKSLRVVGYVASVSGDTPTMRVVTGVRRLTRSAQIAKRMGSVAVAGKVGGTGNALPPTATAASTTPAVATGVHVESNVGTWADDGKALAVVGVEWDRIETAVDGSGLDVVEYEIWWRLPGGQRQRLTATTALLVKTSTFLPGQPVLVTVRGRSVNGKWGAFAPEIGVTPAVPVSIVPLSPSGLTVTSNTAVWLPDGTAEATVGLSWEPVTTSEGGLTITVPEYEVWVRRGGGASALFTRVSSPMASLTGLVPGVTYGVKVRGVSSRGALGVFSGEASVIPVSPLSMVPKPPAGVQVVSNVGTFRPDGTATADVSLSWDPVTQSTDGADVTIAEYQVMVGLTEIRAAYATATFTVPSQRAVDVTVRALTSLGIWGDPSATLEVTGATPDVTLPAPSEPVLSTGLSVVSAFWDGLIGGATPPNGFGSVRMETSDTSTGPWSPTGTPMTTAGGAVIRSVRDAVVFVRLTSYDTLGRVGASSPVASIVVEGVDGDNMKLGSLEVMHVSPAFGGDLQISANDSVQIIVGRQDEQASSIASLTDGVDAAQATASDAASVAGVAQSTASGAQDAADAAALAASDVGARLDQHQTYYRFGTTGLAIGDPATNAELRLKPDAIQMAQNNVVVSEWVGGVFIAPEARLQSALIGNHQWMPYGTGRTIVRPI